MEKKKKKLIFYNYNFYKEKLRFIWEMILNE